MIWRVDVGDCVQLMQAMEPCSVDAVVCDPPYGIRFMGKAWDGAAIEEAAQRDLATRERVGLGPPSGGKGRSASAYGNPGGQAGTYDFTLHGNHAFQTWCYGWAVEALRVLKPGGHLLAFGGTRTYHRLACAVEDAGFEIRDTICWLYGSGFPKSLDVGKAIDKANGAEREVVGQGPYAARRPRPDQGMFGMPHHDPQTAPATPDAERWDGWGTALKPAHEPVVVARKPLAGTVAANVLEHGTGALNIDGGRVGLQNGEVVERDFSKQRSTTGDQTYGDFPNRPSEGVWSNTAGRWPPNVALDQEAAEQLDRQSGELRYGGDVTGHETRSPQWIALEGHKRVPFKKLQDSGGASRFMYVAKASRAERNAGLDGFAGHIIHPDKWATKDRRSGQPRNPRPRDPGPVRNHHPTVKPVSLMRWLCRLVTPPSGLILDPFTGSGTTGIAAVLEGFNFHGMEQDEAYADIARARIGWWELHGHDALRIVAEREAAENEREAVRASGQLELLAEGAVGTAPSHAETPAPLSTKETICDARQP